jgi:subtilase family serine protease
MKTTTIQRRKPARSIRPWTGLPQAAGSLRDPARRDRAVRPLLEPVEERLLLSGASQTMTPDLIRLGPARATPLPSTLNPEGTAAPNTYTPAQFQQVYGFNQIEFEGSPGNGLGQTIAIVDAYNDPNITGDLQAFDRQFNLPAPPLFAVVSQTGSNQLPGTDPTGKWESEEALDVEWAHAMAPGASILLVEANNSSPSNMFAAVKFEASVPTVSVVSMSFGGSVGQSDPGNDSTFTTPGGHQGVTFVAGSGDSGVVSYPAASPNVLGVGGTAVILDGNNHISSETAWYYSGGGIDPYENLPSYQDGVVPSGITHRASPDVAYNA